MAAQLDYILVIAGTALLLGSFILLIWLITSSSQVINRYRSLVKKSKREKEISDLELQKARRRLINAALTGGMAYYLNSSLFSIKELADLLRSTLDQDKNKKPLEILDVFSNMVKNGIKVSDRLYQVSDPSEHAFEKIAIDSLLNGIELNSHGFGTPTTKIRLIIESEQKLIYANEKLLKQLFEIIAVNAQESMAGGGVLSIRATEHEGTELSDISALSSVGKHFVFEITDAGTGFSEESMEHAFDPFYTTKSGTDRLGLGLSVAYGIVAMHDGHISIENRKNLGAKIKVYLPQINPATISQADYVPISETPVEKNIDYKEIFTRPGISGRA